MRLQKILAAAGFASRRGAEELLRQGRVAVNGVTARLGDVADPKKDVVCLDGDRVTPERLDYWIAHKPAGFVTTVRDPQGRPTILDLLPDTATRLFPVGRLDWQTEGLVLLTNDGALTHILLHPSLGSEREYRVAVRGALPPGVLQQLAEGVWLEDGRMPPVVVGRPRFQKGSETTVFSLTLRQGRNRQIRRSMLALGYPVRRLVRIRMGPLRLGRLPRGEARRLDREELGALREHVQRLRRSDLGSGSTSVRSCDGPVAAAARRRPTSR